jgi:hypothetical protein
MTDDQADDEEQFGASYDDLIERLVDKEWGERTPPADACCVDCGRLIDGDPRPRWISEDPSTGLGVYEPLCKDCDS